MSDTIYDDAPLYDLMFPDAAEPTGFYRERARLAGGPVLEIGCGTGRKLLPIAADGLDCTGLDLSEPMLAEARRKAAERGVDVTWVHGDMTSFDLGRRFGFVFCGANALLHLLDADALVSCLSAVRRHLAPGALFAFDVFNPDVRRLAAEDGVRRRRDDLTRTDPVRGEVTVDVQGRYDAAAQVTRATWYITSASGAQIEAPLDMRCIFPQELPLLLALAGLRLVDRFGDWSGGAFRSDSPLQLCVCAAARD